MLRYQVALSLGLALFVVGCADKDPSPAEFPTTPDAPGTGKVDSLNPAEVGVPPTDPESPKSLVLPEEKAPKPEEAAPAKDVEGKPASESVFTPKELDAIHELPADQQALAIKQVKCPITGKHLGIMGMPFATKAEGRTVFLCCDGCEAELQEDPKSALAKLPKK
jgi:hypothetical protein